MDYFVETRIAKTKRLESKEESNLIKGTRRNEKAPSYFGTVASKN